MHIYPNNTKAYIKSMVPKKTPEVTYLITDGI